MARTSSRARELPVLPWKCDLLLCSLFFSSQAPLCCLICLWCWVTSSPAKLSYAAPHPCDRPTATASMSQKLPPFQPQGSLHCKPPLCTANTIQLLNRPRDLLRRSQNRFIHLSAAFWSKQFWCSEHQHLFLVPKEQHLFELKNQWCYLGGLFEVSFVVAV